MNYKFSIITERVRELFIAYKRLIGKCSQKGHQGSLLLRIQIHSNSPVIAFSQSVIKIRMVLNTPVIEVDYFLQSFKTSIMHVRASEFNVSQ